MNDLGPFPSEPTLSDDVDVVEAFSCPDQGQYSSSSTLPAPLPTPFPSETVYTRVPEYVLDPTIPISEGRRNNLYFIQILINCITAVLQSARHCRQWENMQLMPYSPYMMASDFAVPFPPQHDSAGGDQQQMVPSNHTPVLQQPGPSHPTSLSDITKPCPSPCGKDNRKPKSSRRKRDAGQKHRAVGDASVRRYKKCISYCPFHRRGLTTFQHCASVSPSFWRHSSGHFKWESVHTSFKIKNQLIRYRFLDLHRRQLRCL